MNEISRKPAHTVAELASALQHQGKLIDHHGARGGGYVFFCFGGCTWDFFFSFLFFFGAKYTGNDAHPWPAKSGISVRFGSATGLAARYTPPVAFSNQIKRPKGPQHRFFLPPPRCKANSTCVLSILRVSANYTLWPPTPCLAASSMLWRPTLRSDRQLYALEANSMLWPPTPCVSPQLHQATSRPGFHGAWWYRSRTTRVLRDPPPARGKRQGGDDGRTKTTPQHRGRNERGRGPSLRARAPRGLHARRVSHGHTSHASLVASSAAPARGGVASLRRADRGDVGQGLTGPLPRMG